eukprot:g7717.t1
MSIYSLVPFLSESDVDLPGSLKQHCFEKLKTIVRRNNPELESRDQLIHAWKTRKVSELYNRFREEGSPYNSKLLDGMIHSGLFRRDTTKEEIENNLVTKAYHELSNSEIEAMKAEFYSTRQNLYQRILAVEAECLNCDISEVRPTVPVHPLNYNEAESKLCQLPDDVFLNILARLESIEVYRTTLVCKKWRQFVCRYSSAFKRIEYAPTTHLITFTEWMNPSSELFSCEISIRDCLARFNPVGWALMKRCCETFPNLETCVLKGLYPLLGDVEFILKKCRNIKNLQFTMKSSITKIDLRFLNLEMLIVDQSIDCSNSSLVRRAFTNSNGLRGFRGELTSRLIMHIEARKPMAFSNLIALELVIVPSEVLETLSNIDQLKLRYLKLGDTSDMQRHSISSSHFEHSEIDDFYNLLSRLGQLEVLISMVPKRLNYKTIQVLTMLRLGLKQTVICLDCQNSHNQEYNEIEGIISQIDPQATIASFAKMLVKQDSSVDLSAFELIVDDEESRSVLQGANTGLSIYNRHDDRSLYYDTLSLSHPVMRRQLGIDF